MKSRQYWERNCRESCTSGRIFKILKRLASRRLHMGTMCYVTHIQLSLRTFRSRLSCLTVNSWTPLNPCPFILTIVTVPWMPVFPWSSFHIRSNAPGLHPLALTVFLPDSCFTYTLLIIKSSFRFIMLLLKVRRFFTPGNWLLLSLFVRRATDCAYEFI